MSLLGRSAHRGHAASRMLLDFHARSTCATSGLDGYIAEQEAVFADKAGMVDTRRTHGDGTTLAAGHGRIAGR